MNSIALRMKTLLDLNIPSMYQVDERIAAMKINSEWDVKITIQEKKIIYEARSKGKTYDPKGVGVPEDVKGVIEALEEKYSAALLTLLDEQVEYSDEPVDNVQEAPVTPEEVPPVVTDSTQEESIPQMSKPPKTEKWSKPSPKGYTQKENVIDASYQELGPCNLPAPVGVSGIVRPAVTARQALAAWREFQELKKYIIEPSDLQEVEIYDKKTGTKKKKSFVVKSGWRKFATFYNLTDRIVEETKEPSGQGGFLWKIKVVCTAPNGRETEGVGMCSSTERGFAHPDHDIYATAHTRAKNRAISDMIAAGEVSYEEIAADGVTV